MGGAVSMSTQIEIGASPELVRSVFLNWQRYPEWTKVFHLTTPQTGKEPVDLRPDDIMKVNMNGTVFNPTVLENTPEVFKWRGDFYGLFAGTHQCYFNPSQKYPGNTLFVQKEDFTGPLTILFKLGRSSEIQAPGEDQFSRDLKEATEKVARD